MESSASPLSSQQWCNFLLYGLLACSHEPNLVHQHDEVKAMLADSLQELQMDFCPPPSNHCPTVPVDEAQKTLWELTELNFHFELLSLDKRALGSSFNQYEHEQQAMVLKCFKVPSLVVADAQLVNTGLQAHDWQERLLFLLVLRALMRVWDGLKLTPLVLPDLAYGMYTEGEVQELEDYIACFYMQMFYCLFGCTAVIPT